MEAVSKLHLRPQPLRIINHHRPPLTASVSSISFQAFKPVPCIKASASRSSSSVVQNVNTHLAPPPTSASPPSSVAMVVCKKERKKEDLRDFKLLIAQIRVIEGNYNDALNVYQGLVKEEPRDFRPYLCQGFIYTLLKKNDEAEKQFQKYKSLSFRQIEIRSCLRRICNRDQVR